MDEIDWSQVPQEWQDAVMRLSTIPDEQALLEQQLARAKALRAGGNERFRTPAAAGIQALGNLVRGGIGLSQESEALAHQQALIKALGEGRGSLKKIEDFLGKPADYSDVPDVEEALMVGPAPRKKRRPVLGPVSGF